MDPTVTELAVTAVKGFGLTYPQRLRLERGGVPGNRDFFLVEDDDELFSVAKSGCFLPYWSTHDDGVLRIGRDDEVVLSGEVRTASSLRGHFFGDTYVEGSVVEGPWAEFLSDVAGRGLRLVKAAEPAGGYDVHPVTLMSRASAAALGDEADGSTLDGRRFRMLLTVDGVAAFAEDRWQGSRCSVGSAVLELGGPVSRCAAVQRHPDDGRRGVNALRLINEVRGTGPSEFGDTLNLGIYAEVLEPGWLQVGDALRVSAGTGAR
jgi:uncharacterized protein YcbX